MPLGRPVRLLVVAVTASALTALLLGAPAHAEEQPVQLSAKALDQQGEFFDLTLEPGQTRELKIALGNNGSTPIAARSYAADVYTIINGGFGAALRGDQGTGTTTWLNYPSQVVTLQPDRATVRTFSVTVPVATPPGEYITSLVLENDAPVKGSGSVALDQVVRQAVAVAVTVPGALNPGLAIGPASHKVAAERSVVAVEVTNTGNRRLTPEAEIVVHDRAGEVVSRATVPMDSFYAGSTTQVEITLATTLNPGDYTVDLTLDDDARDAHAAAAGQAFTVTAEAVQPAGTSPLGRQVMDVLQTPGQWPVTTAVLVALVVVVGAVTAARLRRAHRRPARHAHRAPRPSARPVLTEPEPTHSPGSGATPTQPRTLSERAPNVVV